MTRSLPVAIFVLLSIASAWAADYYVAPTGTTGGTGTRSDPWDLQSALDGTRPLRPGDRVLLLEGVYRKRPDEYFVIKISGASGQPVTIGAAPNAHPVIDGGLRVLDPAKWLVIRDLDIMVTEPDSTVEKPAEAGSFPKLDRPWGGIDAQSGEDIKFVDLSIHGCRQGMGLWKDCLRAEVSGCIIYDNGWIGLDRGHGHGIYTQNAEGVKTIRNCIFTGGRGYTLHAYGSSRAYVDNYVVEDNIFYRGDTALLGGSRPSSGITVKDNCFYQVPLRLGYDAKDSRDCTVIGNLIAGDPPRIEGFATVRAERNRIVRPTDPRPNAPEIRLYRDPYNPKRANLAVFNWRKSTTVSVKLAGFAREGQTVAVFDPRDLRTPMHRLRCDRDGFQLPQASEFGAYVLVLSE